MVWAWFMQMTNCIYAAAHLEYSKSTNIRKKDKNKFVCICMCCKLSGKFS